MGGNKSDRRKQVVPCDQCGLMVMRKNLKRHLREQHHQQVALTFSCPECEFYSYRSHDLLRHQENIHGRKMMVEAAMKKRQDTAPPRAADKVPSAPVKSAAWLTAPAPESPLEAVTPETAIPIKYQVCLRGYKRFPRPFPGDPKPQKPTG